MNLRKQVLMALSKHLGPGPHPDGSEQSVHAGKRGKQAAEETPDEHDEKMETPAPPKSAPAYNPKKSLLFHGAKAKHLQDILKNGIPSAKSASPSAYMDALAYYRSMNYQPDPESDDVVQVPNWMAEDRAASVFMTDNLNLAASFSDDGYVFRVEVPDGAHLVPDEFGPTVAVRHRGNIPADWITGVVKIEPGRAPSDLFVPPADLRRKVRAKMRKSRVYYVPVPK